jgi:ubiquinone/menaquinone biosynthesis C-methylase UbiE
MNEEGKLRGTAESQAVAERYARRRVADPRYSILNPDVWMTLQERQRAVLRRFAAQGLDLPGVRLLEVGCGEGGNLLELMRMGFVPERLIGAELIEARFDVARSRLPQALQLHLGDAVAMDLPNASQDIVFVSTVFSSILDASTQQALAAAMWRWLRPGGAVLWYDFTVDNPRNPDVRGVPRARLAELFPEGQLRAQRVTLAPPIARRVCRLHPALYTVFNTIPLLRTHLLAWITKS